ncbi:MAG: RND transporter [Prosthecochloris sp.]|uniref:efflux RND transporter periplasmic adaptor subunit n=1 Tax=Prosthecochloris sp. TaxID=290513 RepID=UPI0013C79CE1|nr:HlyD family efflux transporter periplasmic adaptor subunit [Prosthecochloris sp.]NEX11936.1 RND transporter [Prosthecochloris sp.]
MNKKPLIIALVALLVSGAATGVWFMVLSKKEPLAEFRSVTAITGTIDETVSTTGVVEPRNRLKIQSSIAGRVEEILVSEGDMVNQGEQLALVSSTERAALLDAARLQDPGEQAYWERVYKKTVILSPIDAQIIVRSIEPGQTVTTSDSLFVLSDRLIVKAYVDETDIGRIAIGQKADISLDAYPDIRVGGTVEHIDYESHLESNVNIYYVDIIPETIPDVFRSGMSADIGITVQEKQNAVLLPIEAVQTVDGMTVVLGASADGMSPASYKPVTTGLQDEEHVEIVDGLQAGDIVLLSGGSFALPVSNGGGSSPFIPQRRKR